MFKFLKEKLKGAISKISEGVEKEGKTEETIVEASRTSHKEEHVAEEKKEAHAAKPKEEIHEEKKGFFAKLKDRFSKHGEENPHEDNKPKSDEIAAADSKSEEEKKSKLEEEKRKQELAKKEDELKKLRQKQEEEAKKSEAEKKKTEEKLRKEEEHLRNEKGRIEQEEFKRKKNDNSKKEKELEKKRQHAKLEEEKIRIEKENLERKEAERKKEQARIDEEIKKKAEEIKEGILIQKAVKENINFSQKESKVEIKDFSKVKKSEAENQETEPKKIEEEHQEKKGFFAAIKEKIITTRISEEQFENLFWEMELALMENNVAVEVIEKIKSDLKKQLVDRPIKRGKVEDTILETLKMSIEGLFESSSFSLIDEIKNKKEKPYVVAFLGINGSGKTTSIAKIASMLKEKGFSVVLAAGDTFRAASIEQLSLHAQKVGVKLIKHDYGSDPAAVAFDAIKHAKSKGVDIVLIDTAGRMHSNSNLMEEMRKIIRVAKPDMKIFIGESITGNDCVEQAKTFNETVGIDGIILSKADIDEKGGAAISVSYVTKKPILYLGTGQEYKDIEEFDKERIIRNIGLD